ncbi:proton-dependent oligopeptide transport family protein [Arabidopsis lyrata subsp. lyrata]|uniref:Proton-dependent oligopeptide transport family protein n=1 Tax=Arabidopsis lyrata subsp. lyrata TaxID=81972 RepID=D7LMQ0_ARALL|nr:proton-dependent oligopeptide transport family protein [Arabidopsis lyrata subsp. lyrata]
MAGFVSHDAEAPISADSSTRRSGGRITFPFMIATEKEETICILKSYFLWCIHSVWPDISYVGMVTELDCLPDRRVQHEEHRSRPAAKILDIFSGFTFMFPAIGAIAADSFFGTIPVISVSAFISLVTPSLRNKICQAPTNIQLGVLYTAITLGSVGAGGLRFTLATAGANQYEKTEDQGSFFNCFFFTWYLAASISVTAIVYTEENISWSFGFGLCVAANLLGLMVFISGKRFYKHECMTSLWEVPSQVYFASSFLHYLKEKLWFPPTRKTTTVNQRSRQQRVSALKQDDEVNADSTIRNQWRLCSVKQVEDFKAVIRIIPLVLAIIFLSTPIAMQLGLTVLQGLVMDRRLGPHFKIPAGSLQVITLLSTCLFLIVNDRFLYPFYQKLTGKFPTPIQRVGIGHVFNIISMAMTAIVEAKRLKIVQNVNLLESSSVADMSVLWLFPPLVIVGIGEAFHFPGNVALCYQEFPESMRSPATSITSVVIGICFYTSTALIDLIQRTTAWLPDDINHGRVDNVYWVLVIGGVLNLVYFLVCSWFYKYRNLKNDDHEQDASVFLS